MLFDFFLKSGYTFMVKVKKTLPDAELPRFYYEPKQHEQSLVPLFMCFVTPFAKIWP